MKSGKLFLILTLVFCSAFFSCKFGDEEEEKIELKNASFVDDEITLQVGESRKVDFVLDPVSLTGKTGVKYSIGDGGENIVTFSEETDSGLIIKGVKNGSCVIVAKAKEFTSYLSVKVKGNLDVKPYINVSEPVVILHPGERASVNVNVVNMGNAVPDSFILERSNEEVCSCESAGGFVVVEALKKGFSKIEIKTSGDIIPSSILIYVVPKGEIPCYITTDRNVVVCAKDSDWTSVKFTLIGSVDNDLSLFNYELKEGSDVLRLSRSNNICSFMPLKEGNAVITASHPDSDINLDIQVMVVNTDTAPYIKSSDSLIYIDDGIARQVSCEIIGYDEKDYSSSLDYELEDDTVCRVTKVNGSFYIEPLKDGRTKLYITSSLCEKPLELMVVIENYTFVESARYITTSQNVIRMEKGDETELNCCLIGGNEADRNNFIWTIDDSSVIEVTCDSGNVVYRSALNPVTEMDVLNAKAFIRGKKTGKTTIEITNPKAGEKCIIQVLVYEKGTLYEPLRLGGNGLIKVIKGETGEYQAKVISGSFDGQLNWSSDDESIAKVYGNTLNVTVSAVGSGSTKIRAKNDSLKEDYVVEVLCGTVQELSVTNALYVSSPFNSVFVNNNCYVNMQSENPVNPSLWECISHDENICRAVMSQNVLSLKGIKSGSTSITVSHPECTNTVTVYIDVMDEQTVDHPYFFKGDKFIGCVIGEAVNIEAVLQGAKESEYDGIVWECEDSSVISITGNGRTCHITALKEGQTVLRAFHPLSSNKYEAVVYTAPTQEILAGKKIITLSKYNFISEVGETVYIEAYVNDDSVLEWESSDISLLRLDVSQNSCYCRCLDEGNVKITVSSQGQANVNAYISIKGEDEKIPSVKIPEVLEILTGSVKTINAENCLLSDDEISELEWVNQDDEVCIIKANADVCKVQAIKEGTSVITVRGKDNISSRCLVIAADDPDSFYSKYYLTIDKSLVNLMNGEKVTLRAGYATLKPDDYMLSKLSWESSDNSVIKVNGNGLSCDIMAVNEGNAVVTLSGEGFGNTVSVMVTVGENITVTPVITGPKMIGIVRGQSDTVEVKLIEQSGNMINSKDNEFIFCVKEGYEDKLSLNFNGNTCIVTPLVSGTSFIEVSHPLSKDKLNIMVYSADTEELLNSFYPMSTDKDHYLLKIGKSASLILNTLSDEGIGQIKWSVQNGTCINYEVQEDKRVLNITGKKEGVCKITARHEGAEDVVFTVTVTKDDDNASWLLTGEPVIALVKGQDKNISLNTTLPEEYISEIEWKSSDENIVTVSASGKDAVFTAVSEGYCEITAEYSRFTSCTMVVYVCQSLNEISNKTYFNIDRRNIYLQKGLEISLRPYFYAAVPSSSDINITDLYDNNVVSYVMENGLLKIKGINEGLACLRLNENSSLNNFELNIEVGNGNGGKIQDDVNGYLTSFKTVYFIDAQDKVNPLSLSITPVGFEENETDSIIWTSDSNCITVVGQGKDALIYANTEGQANVKISSPCSRNVLNIRIISTVNEGTTGPYIWTDKSSIEIQAGESETIECFAGNVDENDPLTFSYSIDDINVASFTQSLNTVTVNGISGGQTVLHVKYGNVLERSIVVTVKGVSSDAVYLTTQDNYSVIVQNSYKRLSVVLNNYEEINDSEYSWEVENPSDNIISLEGSGDSRICRALNPGLATIKVNHSKALYDLYLYVRVSDWIDEHPVYISAPQTVITVTEGQRTTFTVGLENSDSSQYNRFVWTPPQDGIARIQGAGNQCVIQGIETGVTRMSVSHPLCQMGSLDLIIIVEQDLGKDSLYISTDQTLFEMKPTDSYRQIFVTLTGGKPEQNALFRWSILSFESTLKNQDGTSRPVISLSASQDSAIVKPLNEGNAVIRVTNEATKHKLDIKVVVQLYSTLKFTSPSLNIIQGQTDSVDIETPGGKTVIYESSNERVATATGTNRKCIIEGTGKGTAVIRAYASDNSCSDELIVNVTEDPTFTECYITTDINVLSLNLTDDSGGKYINAVLNGSNAASSDQNNLKWTVTGDSVKFVSNSQTVSGKQVMIKPVKAGEAVITVSHTKAHNSKNVYISVEQNIQSLVLSEEYVPLSMGDSYYVSASIKNASDGENDKIVWQSLSPETVALSNAVNGKVTGRGCGIISRKKGEAQISCTYGGMTRYVTVFIKEDPSISFPEGNRMLGCGQTVRIKLNVYPPEYIEQVELTSSSSVYCIVKGEIDKTNSEYWVNVQTTQIPGETTVTAELLGFKASLKINVTDDVSAAFKKLVICDKDNKTREIINPGSVTMDMTDKWARVYYKTYPKGLSLKVKKNDNTQSSSGYITYTDITEGEVGYFPPSVTSTNFLSYSFGKDNSVSESPDYIQLTPVSGNMGYGSVTLIDYETNMKIYLPVCVTCSNINVNFTTTNKDPKGGSEIDNQNYIIRIWGNNKPVVNPVIKSGTINLYGTDPEETDTNVLDCKTKSGTVIVSTKYAGIYTAIIDYPIFPGTTAKIKRSFIVNHEERK